MFAWLQDGRLQSGDHILQIGDVNLRGMGSEQVAAVLRQSGSHVRLVVARPVEPSSPEFQVRILHQRIEIEGKQRMVFLFLGLLVLLLTKNRNPKKTGHLV